MTKRLKQFLLLTFLPFSAYIFLRLLGFTWRIRVHNPTGFPTPDKNKNEKLIFIFWHNRILVHTYYYRHCEITAMISKSRDGEYIAKVARWLGHYAIRGSSSRKSREALEEAIACLSQNKYIAVTPDGPQGPKYQLQGGAVEMARRTGASIVPMAFDASSKYVFSSWDGFILPKPFSKIVICFGSPVKIPEKITQLEFEAYRKSVENSLNKITEQSHNLMEGVKK
jgi:hypothetical protein